MNMCSRCTRVSQTEPRFWSSLESRPYLDIFADKVGRLRSELLLKVLNVLLELDLVVWNSVEADAVFVIDPIRKLWL